MAQHVRCSSCLLNVACLVCFPGQLKEQGNAAFKAGQLKFARGKYTKALRLADHIFDIETEEQVTCSTLTHALMCVAAAVGHEVFQQVLGCTGFAVQRYEGLHCLPCK